MSREQLRRIGLSDDVIDGWIASKRLHVRHRGVYAVGHERLSRKGEYRAALLACGDEAVLSHTSAADLWEFRSTVEPEIHVTAPVNRRGDAVIRVHHSELHKRETTVRDGIRVTKPLRTLTDLATCVSPVELERAIRQAVYRRLVSTAALADAVAGRSGQRGNAKLRDVLINLGEAPGLIRSDLEQDFLRFLRRHRLPLPELNVKLRIRGRTIEADCLWREPRLIIELDGRDAHASTPAFESDRERDLALEAAGWRTGRVTSRRLRRDARALAAELRALTRPAR